MDRETRKANFKKLQQQQQPATQKLRNTRSGKATATLSDYFNTQESQENAVKDEPKSKKPREVSQKPKKAPKLKSTTSTRSRAAGRGKQQSSISDFLRNEQLFAEVTAQHCLADSFSPDDIEMALALSKSEAEKHGILRLQDSVDGEQPEAVNLLEQHDKQSTQNIRRQLQKYGFRTAAKEDYNLLLPLATGKRGKRCKWANKFTALTLRNPVEQQKKLESKLTALMAQQVRTKLPSAEELKVLPLELISARLKALQATARITHEPGEESPMNLNAYYVEELFEVSSLPANHLLKSWRAIQGRDLSPKRVSPASLQRAQQLEQLYAELEAHFAGLQAAEQAELDELEKLMLANMVEETETSMSPVKEPPDKRARMTEERELVGEGSGLFKEEEQQMEDSDSAMELGKITDEKEQLKVRELTEKRKKSRGCSNKKKQWEKKEKLEGSTAALQLEKITAEKTNVELTALAKKMRRISEEKEKQEFVTAANELKEITMEKEKLKVSSSHRQTSSITEERSNLEIGTSSAQMKKIAEKEKNQEGDKELKRKTNTTSSIAEEKQKLRDSRLSIDNRKISGEMENLEDSSSAAQIRKITEEEKNQEVGSSARELKLLTEKMENPEPSTSYGQSSKISQEKMYLEDGRGSINNRRITEQKECQETRTSSTQPSRISEEKEKLEGERLSIQTRKLTEEKENQKLCAFSIQSNSITKEKENLEVSRLSTDHGRITEEKENQQLCASSLHASQIDDHLKNPQPSSSSLQLKQPPTTQINNPPQCSTSSQLTLPTQSTRCTSPDLFADSDSDDSMHLPIAASLKNISSNSSEHISCYEIYSSDEVKMLSETTAASIPNKSVSPAAFLDSFVDLTEEQDSSVESSPNFETDALNCTLSKHIDKELEDCVIAKELYAKYAYKKKEQEEEEQFKRQSCSKDETFQGAKVNSLLGSKADMLLDTTSNVIQEKSLSFAGSFSLENSFRSPLNRRSNSFVDKSLEDCNLNEFKSSLSTENNSNVDEPLMECSPESFKSPLSQRINSFLDKSLEDDNMDGLKSRRSRKSNSLMDKSLSDCGFDSSKTYLSCRNNSFKDKSLEDCRLDGFKSSLSRKSNSFVDKTLPDCGLDSSKSFLSQRSNSFKDKSLEDDKLDGLKSSRSVKSNTFMDKSLTEGKLNCSKTFISCSSNSLTEEPLKDYNPEGFKSPWSRRSNSLAVEPLMEYQADSFKSPLSPRSNCSTDNPLKQCKLDSSKSNWSRNSNSFTAEPLKDYNPSSFKSPLSQRSNSSTDNPLKQCNLDSSTSNWSRKSNSFTAEPLEDYFSNSFKSPLSQRSNSSTVNPLKQCKLDNSKSNWSRKSNSFMTEPLEDYNPSSLKSALSNNSLTDASIDLTQDSCEEDEAGEDGILLSDDEINYSIWQADKQEQQLPADCSLALKKRKTMPYFQTLEDLDAYLDTAASTSIKESHSNESELSKERAEFGILDAIPSQPFTLSQLPMDEAETNQVSIDWTEASFLDTVEEHHMKRYSHKFKELLEDLPKPEDDLDEFDRMVLQGAQKEALPSGLDRLLLGEIKVDSLAEEEEQQEPTDCSLETEQLQHNGQLYTVRVCTAAKPDYLAMSEPELLQHLYNYGIKPLKRKQAVKLLEFIYNQTHPVMREAEETPAMPRSKSTPVPPTAAREDYQVPIAVHSQETHHFRDASGEDLLRFSQVLSPGLCDDFECFVLQTNVSKKTPQPLLPLHIAWHNLICANPSLHERVLLFEPIDLQEIYQYFKQLGHRYDPKELKCFFDRRCIIFRYELAPPTAPQVRRKKPNHKKANLKL